LKIELDFPPASLFPNRSRGKHWAVTHKDKTLYRDNSSWLTKYQMRRDWVAPGGNIRLEVTFVMPDKRLRDADNCLAAAKAGFDGMADALNVNDRQFQPIVIYRVSGEKPGKMIVEIFS